MLARCASIRSCSSLTATRWFLVPLVSLFHFEPRLGEGRLDHARLLPMFVHSKDVPPQGTACAQAGVGVTKAGVTAIWALIEKAVLARG